MMEGMRGLRDLRGYTRRCVALAVMLVASYGVPGPQPRSANWVVIDEDAHGAIIFGGRDSEYGASAATVWRCGGVAHQDRPAGRRLHRRNRGGQLRQWCVTGRDEPRRGVQSRLGEVAGVAFDKLLRLKVAPARTSAPG